MLPRVPSCLGLPATWTERAPCSGLVGGRCKAAAAAPYVLRHASFIWSEPLVALPINMKRGEAYCVRGWLPWMCATVAARMPTCCCSLPPHSCCAEMPSALNLSPSSCPCYRPTSHNSNMLLLTLTFSTCCCGHAEFLAKFGGCLRAEKWVADSGAAAAPPGAPTKEAHLLVLSYDRLLLLNDATRRGARTQRAPDDAAVQERPGELLA